MGKGPHQRHLARGLPYDHTLVGAIPLAALYWLALRRWRPALARLRSAGLHRPHAG